MIFLFHLPTEVIIRLLCFLSPKELASCARLSKRFLEIIKNSSILTYALEASKAGLDERYNLNRLLSGDDNDNDENSNANLSPSELLADLRRREHGWSTFTWQKHFEIPIGKRYMHFELCGHVFAGGYPRTVGGFAINTIDVYDFQNAKDNGFVTTLSFDMLIAGFSIDAGQDLLVLGEMGTPADAFTNLHIRTLSTGFEYTHTDIKQSTLSFRVPIHAGWWMSYRSAVYIHGDNLLFPQYTRESCDVKMINWKTAQTLTVYSGPDPYSCAMISETEALLIGCGSKNGPEIKYYTINKDELNKASSPKNEDNPSTEKVGTTSKPDDENENTSAEDDHESDWEDVPEVNNGPIGPNDIVVPVNVAPNTEPIYAVFKPIDETVHGLDPVTFNLPLKNLPVSEWKTWDVGLVYAEVPFIPKPFSPFVKPSTIIYPPRCYLLGVKIQSVANDISPDYERIHTFDFFIHLETLRKLKNTFSSSSSSTKVPWQDWGPNATRVFRNKYPGYWNRRSLRGYRVLTPDFPQFRTVNGNGTMDCVILDFNQKAWTESTPGIIRNTSEVVTQDKNKTKIRTKLPYRKIRSQIFHAPGETNLNIFGVKLKDPYVILGEDIICFDMDSEGDSIMKTMHIFKL